MEHLAVQLVARAVAFDALLTLLLPLPLIVIANWADRPPAGNGWAPQAAAAIGRAVWLLLGLVAAGCLLLALVTIAAAPATPQGGGGGLLAYAAALLVTGIAAASLIAEPARAWIARVIPIDPKSAVHATALVLSIVLVGSQLASQVSADLLTQQASTGQALGPVDLVTQEVPFLLAAALGVGIFIRRTPAAALKRLGLVRPSPWQLLVAVGAAGLFYAFGNGVDALGHVLTPGLAQKVQAANDRLFGELLDPVGIATIALSAGICEETLFRGAMQPRLGVLWTSLVFAAVHTQYGLSLDAVAVFILAVGLGLVRRFTNTTTSTVCHVVYNTLVGVGVAGAWLAPALVIEVGLVLAGLAAVLTGRLGSLRTAP